jgi:hypothetical protein
MNKKQNLIALVIASCICLGSVTARAIPTASLNVTDPFITVGETFTVQVFANNNGLAQGLLGFGFNVDPLSTLAHITYLGYTLAPDFTDSSLGVRNVAGITFPAILTDPVLLATLSFSATSTGSATLTIQGFVNGFDGLIYTGEENLFPIDVSKSITVNAAGVPDSASLWMAALTLTGLCACRVGLRKLSR